MFTVWVKANMYFKTVGKLVLHDKSIFKRKCRQKYHIRYLSSANITTWIQLIHKKASKLYRIWAGKLKKLNTSLLSHIWIQGDRREQVF